MVVKDQSFKCLNNPKSFFISSAKLFGIKLTQTEENVNLSKRWEIHS